jgi:hypothetical protein
MRAKGHDPSYLKPEKVRGVVLAAVLLTVSLVAWLFLPCANSSPNRNHPRDFAPRRPLDTPASRASGISINSSPAPRRPVLVRATGAWAVRIQPLKFDPANVHTIVALLNRPLWPSRGEAETAATRDIACILTYPPADIREAEWTAFLRPGHRPSLASSNLKMYAVNRKLFNVPEWVPRLEHPPFAPFLVQPQPQDFATFHGHPAVPWIQGAIPSRPGQINELYPWMMGKDGQLVLKRVGLAIGDFSLPYSAAWEFDYLKRAYGFRRRRTGSGSTGINSPASVSQTIRAPGLLQVARWMSEFGPLKIKITPAAPPAKRGT